jgi:chromosome segregation ATPase
MKSLFVSRARHQAALSEIDALRVRVLATEKRHDEAEGERRDLADQLNTEQAKVRQLTGRTRRLHGLLEHHRDQGSLGMLRQHRTRLDRALRGCARYMAAYWRARAEIADLTRRLSRATESLIDLRRQLSDAHERARKAEALVAMASERPIDGAPAQRDESLAAELRRARDHARALDRRLAEVTAANHACTCQTAAAEEVAAP